MTVYRVVGGAGRRLQPSGSCDVLQLAVLSELAQLVAGSWWLRVSCQWLSSAMLAKAYSAPSIQRTHSYCSHHALPDLYEGLPRLPTPVWFLMPCPTPSHLASICLPCISGCADTSQGCGGRGQGSPGAALPRSCSPPPMMAACGHWTWPVGGAPCWPLVMRSVNSQPWMQPRTAGEGPLLCFLWWSLIERCS